MYEERGGGKVKLKSKDSPQGNFCVPKLMDIGWGQFADTEWETGYAHR